MEQLDGKIAVVTGAGSGIGQALALRFEAEGMRVVAADVETEALGKTAAELTTGSTFVADVSSYDDVVALAEYAYETYGAVDVLCNNAGVFTGGLMWERPPSDFDWLLGVNLGGILNGIRAFVPRMLAAGNEAHIVNTTSMAGIVSMPFSGPYNVSKFAAQAATECLAHDLAAVGANISVSAVVPSLIATRIADAGRNRPATLAGRDSEDAQYIEQALRDATTQQGIQPADVAALVVDAIRTKTFLVPTKPSYAMQIQSRTDDLLARRLPTMPTID
jgi:NAD(P)-dependent dehydrogenase (short-subunit alcohol dehydrogenase family)